VADINEMKSHDEIFDEVIKATRNDGGQTSTVFPIRIYINLKLTVASSLLIYSMYKSFIHYYLPLLLQ